MKRLRCVGFCMCAAAAAAVLAAEGSGGRVEVGGLGEPAFADGETSRTFALPAAEGRNWRLELSLEGSASNNVEVAFGHDADGDGELAAEEIMAVVGWESGAWFAAGGTHLDEWHESAAPEGRAALRLDVRLPEGGAAVASFSESRGTAVRLPGAAWLDPRGWTVARLTARGGGARAEATEVVAFGDGTLVVLR